MDCQECSTPNSKNASFCELCGEPLTAQASAARRKKELREKRTLEIELTEISQLESDVGAYRHVNEQINRLQTELAKVRTDVVDLGQKTLEAKEIRTTGNSGGTISFGITGCPVDKSSGGLVSYCAQGSPLALNQLTPDGHSRPVASFSDIGFQDISKSRKRNCDENSRGTLFIEKGTGQQEDKAFVCIKGNGNSYSWRQMTIAN